MAQSLPSLDQKLTPMMEQYRSIKKSLSADTILFFRLGDFYEMFFDDALRASEILNITLTGREGGPVGRVPMCGIPYHSFQQYVRILLDRNLKVAICEQIGDPQAAKGLVERKVTRIITPATYLDEEAAPSSRPEYLVAVASDRGTCAIAVLDAGTGEFFVREVGRERLASELALLQPREVILAQGLSRPESLNAAVTVYEDWVFEAAEGARLLREGFSLASEQAIPFHDRPLAVGACGAILYYLRDHLHSALGHIRPPAFLESQRFMALDNQTLRSLELVSSLSDKRKSATLLGTIDSTLTPMGGRTLYDWMTHPLLSLAEIQTRQAGTVELAGSPTFTHAVRSLCKGVKDIERTLSRLSYGVANARDLLGVKIFLERIPEIQRGLDPAASSILKELRSQLKPFSEVRDLIARAIVEDPPLALREGGLIRDGYSRELDELRSLTAKGKLWLMEFEKREAERSGIRSLKVRYNQVFGYSIEVSKPNLHLVPVEYQRKQTLSNAERFVVPELQQWDERITGAQEKIKELEYLLFQEVRAHLLEHLSGLQATARAVGKLDALAALAFTAVQKQWICPEVNESPELSIQGGRHPVVEGMLPAGQFVENDLFLDGSENQLVILTGPNMAGKSTYIRQTALVVLLAQIGSFVPAKSAKVGLVDRIFTRIGARDDLAHGESTFMVEMIEMAHILRSATNRSLLVLDEVGRGTSTFDGVSLAWAICEQLSGGPTRPRTLFATHYHELIQLEEEFAGIKNYTMTVKETSEGVVFLRRVARGGSDRSYGIHVARLAGIPKEVTDRATQILRVLESENTEATRIIEGKPDVAMQDLTPSNPILEELRVLSIDSLTPLEALNRIAEWKGKLWV